MNTEVIYRPWTGNIGNDMKHVRIFPSFEDMKKQLAREYRISPEAIIDGGYADQEIEDIDSGFISSNYLYIQPSSSDFKSLKLKKQVCGCVGLFSIKWNKEIVDSWSTIREGIIYRPKCRGGIFEAMKNVLYFDSFESLQYYILEEYNDNHYMKLKPEEVIASGQSMYDERIGWVDSNYLCIKAFQDIEDTAGYIKFFGGLYDSPQCIGFFATKWNCDQPNGILKCDTILNIPDPKERKYKVDE